MEPKEIESRGDSDIGSELGLDQDQQSHFDATKGAAGLIAAIRKKAMIKEMEGSSEPNYFIEKFIPDPSDRLEDLVLGTLLNGFWQQRRIIITKDCMSFALVGQDCEMDVIPLAEIESVCEMWQEGDPEEFNSTLNKPFNFQQRVAAVASGSNILLNTNKGSVCSTPAIGLATGTISAFQSRRASVELPTNLQLANALQVATLEHGYNSGRIYYLQASSPVQQQELVARLRALSKAARKRAESKSAFAKSQERVRRIHSTRAFQTTAAALIVANFFFNVIEAQFVDKLEDSKGNSTNLGSFLDGANLFFTAIFAVELMVNLFAHWLGPFLKNPWSVLDAFVVFMSLVALGPVDIPITVLRLMRAFRVIRLFGRLKALKKMVSALSASIWPMMNAFLILFIIASIYAIMGVSVFGDDAYYDFGRFEQAFVTMFRMTTEGSWPDSVPSHQEDGSINWKTSLFMMSYIVLVNWVVLQVSVAVLLDNFVSASTAIEEEEKKRRREESGRRQEARSPLEPLLKKLSQVYVDDVDLSEKLRRLYQMLDADGSGGLGCEEFCASIKKLVRAAAAAARRDVEGSSRRPQSAETAPVESTVRIPSADVPNLPNAASLSEAESRDEESANQDVHPRIHMAASDFLSLTQGGALCDADGQLRLENFRFAMREQLRLYAQSQLCNPDQRSRMEAELSQVGALKWVLLEQQALRRDMSSSLQGTSNPFSSTFRTCNSNSTGRSPTMAASRQPSSAVSHAITDRRRGSDAIAATSLGNGAGGRVGSVGCGGGAGGGDLLVLQRSKGFSLAHPRVQLTACATVPEVLSLLQPAHTAGELTWPETAPAPLAGLEKGNAVAARRAGGEIFTMAAVAQEANGAHVEGDPHRASGSGGMGGIESDGGSTGIRRSADSGNDTGHHVGRTAKNGDLGRKPATPSLYEIPSEDARGGPSPHMTSALAVASAQAAAASSNGVWAATVSLQATTVADVVRVDRRQPTPPARPPSPDCTDVHGGKYACFKGAVPSPGDDNCGQVKESRAEACGHINRGCDVEELTPPPPQPPEDVQWDGLTSKVVPPSDDSDAKSNFPPPTPSASLAERKSIRQLLAAQPVVSSANSAPVITELEYLVEAAGGVAAVTQ